MSPRPQTMGRDCIKPTGLEVMPDGQEEAKGREKTQGQEGTQGQERTEGQEEAKG
jgi:hypothetical protein